MIVLTGANRGIGYEIGSLLSRSHTVIAITRDDTPIDYPCIQIQHDITHDISGLFEKIREHGIPSSLINCAGVLGGDMIDVNLKSAIELTEEFIKKTDSGHIVHFGSLSKEYPSTDPIYTATKSAIEEYVKHRRKQCRSHKFTTVIPGYVNTDMIRGCMPMYRPLDPVDVAEAVEFIISRPTHVELREVVLSSSYQREC